MPLDDIEPVTGPPPAGRTREVSVNRLFFDLDGVLVDSAATIERHWREFAGWYWLDAERFVQGTHGRKAADTIMDLEPELPVPLGHSYQSARSAACRTLGITTTHHRHELGAADFVCPDLGSVEVLRADKERVDLRLRLKS